MPNLQIYFINAQESFQFQSSSKKEITKWVNEISKVLTGRDSSRSSVQNQFAIPGAAFVAETLKDTIGIFKGAFGIKSEPNDANVSAKVTTKCIGCMAYQCSQRTKFSLQVL